MEDKASGDRRCTYGVNFTALIGFYASTHAALCTVVASTGGFRSEGQWLARYSLYQKSHNSIPVHIHRLLQPIFTTWTLYSGIIFLEGLTRIPRMMLMRCSGLRTLAPSYTVIGQWMVRPRYVISPRHTPAHEVQSGENTAVAHWVCAAIVPHDLKGSLVSKLVL
jgi:hypothetical protein